MVERFHEASLLTTMAILKAQYDVKRDFLANFEPFAVDCVKYWPIEDPVVLPERLREQLCLRFALPAIPIHVAQELRERLQRDGYLVRRRGTGRRWEHVRDEQRLREVPGLTAARDAALGRMEDLRQALASFTGRNGAEMWPRERSQEALEAFIQEFSAEVALSARSGNLAIERRAMDADVAVVHAFVRTTLRSHSRLLDVLEDMVKGSMLVNVLYFQGLGDWKTRLPRLEVYLDTAILLRALGLAPREQAAAAKELVTLAADFEISLRVFQHTVDEMGGVLDALAESLEGAKRRHVRPTELLHINREALDHLIAQRWTAIDVHTFAADLPAKLRRLRVQVVDAPARPAHPELNEVTLERTLKERVSKQPHAARRKDLESLVAVHTLRGGRNCRTLEDTPAVFVTSNTSLVRASAEYFEGQQLESHVRHCVSDVSLTTQLWVRRPERHRRIARKLLIAESWAALSAGPPGLYDRYLVAIEKQMDAGALSDEQVKLLVYRMETREPLLDVTHGDADAVTGATPFEVLQRFQQDLVAATTSRFDELRHHLITTIVPGVLIAATGMAALVGLGMLIAVGAVRHTIPVGPLAVGDVAVIYCAFLICIGHLPQMHSRLWHLAAFLVVVPLGCGIAAWAMERGGGWWMTAMVAVSGLFSIPYAIFAFSRSSPMPAE